MSFLHRRSRSASASRPQTPASANAHKAATQAFLSSRTSHANLSASAAAQALRTMTPPPVPVDQVQTKRMVERQASSASLSNSARGRGRGGMQRQNSGGSMTERTFRTPSPSPSRPVSRVGPPAPPMPSIPQQYAPQSIPVKNKKRASSQEAPPPRVLSPPPMRPESRGQSLDRFGNPQTPPTNAPKKNQTPQSEDLERLDSRNSINFSRPLSPRPQSPPPQSPVSQSPVLTNGNRVKASADANVVTAGLNAAQAAGIQHDLSQTANQPVKKKRKKKMMASAAEGSHLQSGTMASKPVDSPLAPIPEAQSQQAPVDPQPTRKKKPAAVLTGENTHFPQPDSPRTDSDSDSNVGRKSAMKVQRASGILQKQPSIVREDWEGEQQDTTLSQIREAENYSTQDRPVPVQDEPSSVSVSGATSFYAEATKASSAPSEPLAPKVNQAQQPTVVEQLPALMGYLQVNEPQSTRGTSLSPSRSTRFSDRLSSDLAAGRKHEPLPRSVSPAKPALKHPSPSARIDGQVRGSSVTPSESSDVSSVSLEGPPRRKKSARVSFDAQPEVVGAPEIDQSPVGSSGKERKSWHGLGKSKPPLTTIPSNDDMEELMKPRPQLPSFGSVRSPRTRETDDQNSTPTPQSPPQDRSPPAKSNLSSLSGSSSEVFGTYNANAGVSTDHAVGAIFAQEAQRSSQNNIAAHTNEPLPPEVRSVEGILSYSDEDSDASEIGESPHVSLTGVADAPQLRKSEVAPPTFSVNQLVTAPIPSVSSTVPTQHDQPTVPTLALLPPTPAEEHKHFDEYGVEIPGGFPISAATLAQLDESNNSLHGRNKNKEESDNDTDNDSIYSDAAEDPSEMEGMGFASIDAILESPIAPQAVPHRSQESPPSNTPAPRPDAARTTSWEQTQARWSGIAQQTRQAPAQQASATEQAPVPVAMPDEQPVPQAETFPEDTRQATAPPRRKKKTSPAAIAAAASVPAAAASIQGSPKSPLRNKKQPSAYPQAQPQNPGHAAAAAAPFRNSMRDQSVPETDPALRKTMRTNNRKSMPASAMSAPQQRAQHPPVSAPPSQPRGALQKKKIPLATAAAANAPLPRAQPAPAPVNNDSDSDSSFRKARRSKATAGGPYAMRRSMRGAAEPTTRSDPRNRVRSVSPVGRRAFSPPANAHSMRASMRGSVDNTPTLRGNADAKRSSSLFGRQPSRSTTALPAGVAKSDKSRVDDSDDEDEQPRPSKFRSRFEDDSDDDVDVPQFAPVRGIPRRNHDADSTDLDDSSDEVQAAPASKAPPKLQIPQDNTVANNNTEPLSPNSEKKKGLFGMFRSKKPKDEPMSPVAASPQTNNIKATTDTSKPSRLGFASNAERDRVIAQTRAKLEAAREQPAGAKQPGPGKLQRRQMPERVMSDSWPLPPTVGDEKLRPNTADGMPVRNGTTRLNQGSMRQPNVANAAIGRSGKKKKFPMLRKAFGLKD